MSKIYKTPDGKKVFPSLKLAKNVSKDTPSAEEKSHQIYEAKAPTPPNRNTMAWYQWIGIVAEIVAITVGIVALWMADQANKSSDEQFRISMHKSDSTFKSQMKANESLIGEVKSLQDITGQQVQMTANQLEVQKVRLAEEMYLGRPIIIMEAVVLSDTNKSLPKYFKPTITSNLVNLGKRDAIKVERRDFIIYRIGKYFKLSEWGQTIIESMQPSSSKIRVLNPVLPSHTMDDFYLCTDLKYFDKKTGERFSYKYFFHYRKHLSSGFKFYDASNEDENQLLKTLNLGLQDQRLFGD